MRHNIRPTLNIRIAYIFTVILMSVPLGARDKSDVLVMNNGDRLTCEITQLDHGIVYVKLDYVDGTISIDWSKVKSVESTQMFTVVTARGSTYTGTLTTAESPEDQPITIEVADAASQQTSTVEQSEIVHSEEYGNSLWHRLHGSLSSGFNYHKANNDTQYSLGADLSYVRERSRLDLSYNSVLSNTSGTTETTRNQVEFKAQRLLHWSDWYYEGGVGYLENSAQRITSQSRLGVGVGRYLINSNSTQLQLTGGLGWQSTSYTGQPTEKDSVAIIEGNLNMFRFKKVTLTVTPILLPFLTDGGRVRFNLNAQLKLQIIDNLWWNVSLYGNWDNRPPAGLIGNDYGTSLGLTYSFH